MKLYLIETLRFLWPWHGDLFVPLLWVSSIKGQPEMYARKMRPLHIDKRTINDVKLKEL